MHRSNARIRQTWHNDGKGSRGCDDDGKASTLLNSDYYQNMSFQAPEVNAMDRNQAQKYCAHIKSDSGVRESHLVFSRSLKRVSPYCSSVIEANNGHVQKIRAIVKEETKNTGVSEFNNSDTDACSVGSCSVTSQSPNNYHSHVIPLPLPLPCQVTDAPCSDVESCYGPGSGSEGKSGPRLPKEEVEARIHRAAIGGMLQFLPKA
ncbi:unnamed protein product [Fraxinus pennsylvanica]|uniref:Uncharacterized protein n=1 Tax=Fraxinus pennsylvanica TaxID=56036 RepID=A0AAD1YT83_9LAMI|nr:unnamed protein product [Fraxinus pennsylvanica]